MHNSRPSWQIGPYRATGSIWDCIAGSNHAGSASVSVLNDRPLLHSLLQEVERQKRKIDCNYPGHMMSSFSASDRGYENTCDSPGRQISMLIRFQEAGGGELIGEGATLLPGADLSRREQGLR